MKDNSSDARESLWRRKLSEPERAGLRTQPELELEARLTEALTRLPDAPVPSNFTARVLETIALDELQAARSRGWPWNWRSLLPRLALAAGMMALAGLGLQRHERHLHRAELVKHVALVAVATPPPSLEALENLEAIQRMGQSAHADGELLAALQ